MLTNPTPTPTPKQAAPLLKVLKEIIADDVATSEPPHPNLSVLGSFAKYLATDPMILSPAVRGAEAAEAAAAAAAGAEAEAGGGSEAPPPCVLVEVDQRAVRDGLASYYARVVASAQRAFTELRAVAKANQKVLLFAPPPPHDHPPPGPHLAPHRTPSV